MREWFKAEFETQLKEEAKLNALIAENSRALIIVSARKASSQNENRIQNSECGRKKATKPKFRPDSKLKLMDIGDRHANMENTG